MAALDEGEVLAGRVSETRRKKLDPWGSLIFFNFIFVLFYKVGCTFGLTIGLGFFF